MTLKRTTHRREARKRAKAAIAERLARRERMTPHEREVEQNIRDVFKAVYGEMIEQRIQECLMWQTCCGTYDIMKAK